MNTNGWFKLHRTIFDGWIWEDIHLLRLFLYLIGQAVFSEEGIRKGDIHIKRGQFLRSYRNIRDDLTYLENNAEKQYSLSHIKKMVERLDREQLIRTERTKLGTLFTVLNYASYQALEVIENNKSGELRTMKEQDKNRLRTAREQRENNNKNVKKVKKDKNVKEVNNTLSGKPVPRIPYKSIVDHLNLRIGSRYKHTTKKTRKLIKERWNEGFREEDFFTVIDKKCIEWINCDMKIYLRPETLFGSKFESYLNQLSVKPRGQSKQEAKDEMLRKLYQEALEEERKGGSDEEDRLD